MFVKLFLHLVKSVRHDFQAAFGKDPSAPIRLWFWDVQPAWRHRRQNRYRDIPNNFIYFQPSWISQSITIPFPLHHNTHNQNTVKNSKKVNLSNFFYFLPSISDQREGDWPGEPLESLSSGRSPIPSIHQQVAGHTGFLRHLVMAVFNLYRKFEVRF